MRAHDRISLEKEPHEGNRNDRILVENRYRQLLAGAGDTRADRPVDDGAGRGQFDQGKENGRAVVTGEPGERMRIRGRVMSLDGTPVPNAVITFRHADAEGLNWSYYLGDVQANEKGVYQFGSVVPGNSHRLSHVHVYVSHEGFQYLDTEFYFKRDPKADPDDNPEEGTTIVPRGRHLRRRNHALRPLTTSR